MNTFPLLISLVLVAIAACGVSGENEAVLDFEGKPVKANVPYYVRRTEGEPQAWISRYGVRKVNAPFSCPQLVVLAFATEIVEPTIPVIFVQSSSSSDVVRVSMGLNIKFTRRAVICRESGFWRVPDSSMPDKEVLLTGSKSSNDSTFTIHKFKDSYKFVFGNADSDNSTDIGLDVINSSGVERMWRLILSKNFAVGVTFSPALAFNGM